MVSRLNNKNHSFNIPTVQSEHETFHKYPIIRDYESSKQKLNFCKPTGIDYSFLIHGINDLAET